MFYILRKPSPRLQLPHDTEFRQINGKFNEPFTCPACHRHVSMLQWKGPFTVSLEVFGQECGDIAYSSSDGVLVSDRFRSAFLESKLTGIATFHLVTIKSIDGSVNRPISSAYYFVNSAPVTVDVDDNASCIVRDSNDCAVCRGDIERADSIAIRQETWIGLDWFRMVSVPGIIIISDRMKRVIEKHNITNVDLIPAHEFRISWS